MPAGIDALMDIVAAPPVRAPRDASAPPDAPSFDDHLEAEAPETPQRTEVSATEDAPAETAKDADEDSGAPTNVAPTPPQPCAPPVAPLSLQIIDAIDAAMAPPTDEAIAADADAPQAPVTTPPPIIPAPMTKPAPVKARHADAALKSADAQEAPAVTDAPESETAKPVESAKQAAPIDASQTPDDDTPAAPPQVAPQQDAPPPQQAAQIITAAPSAKPAPVKADANSAPAIDDVTDAPAPKATPAAPTQNAPVEPEADAPSTRQAEAPAQSRSAQKADAPSAPTAAPRETFTALLAQQQDAPQLALPQAAVGGTSATAAATPAHLAAQHAAATAAPSAQVGREIIRKFNGENTRFEVRLDPPELGRVEVKLEVTRDHRVTAVVAADSPQTLADLTRHARDIEQALQSAGLELGDDGLSFDLSQHRENLADARDDQSSGRGASAPDRQDSTPIPARALTLDAWRGARVDLVA